MTNEELDEFKIKLSEAETLRGQKDLNQILDRYFPLIKDLKSEQIILLSSTDRDRATALFGFTKIIYDAITTQIKDEGLRLVLSKYGQELRLVDEVFILFGQYLRSPKTIHNNPLNVNLEVKQDIGNRLVATGQGTRGMEMMREAVDNNKIRKPIEAYSPNSEVWLEYLGTMSALSVLMSRIGRYENNLDQLKDGLQTFLEIFAIPIIQNGERLTTLALWTGEMAVHKRRLDVALLAGWGLIRSFTTKPAETIITVRKAAGARKRNK